MKKFSFLFFVILIAGCGNVQRNDFQMIKDILKLAQEDKVAGELKVHLNGKMEAGFSEGIYFGSPGSVIDAELMFKMKNVGGE